MAPHPLPNAQQLAPLDKNNLQTVHWLHAEPLVNDPIRQVGANIPATLLLEMVTITTAMTS